jgi:hypothetical protein
MEVVGRPGLDYLQLPLDGVDVNLADISIIAHGPCGCQSGAALSGR